MALIREDLMKLGIREKDLESMNRCGKYYTILNEKRRQHSLKKQSERSKLMESVKESHALSMSFLNSLAAKDTTAIHKFLLRQNMLTK